MNAINNVETIQVSLSLSKLNENKLKVLDYIKNFAFSAITNLVTTGSLEIAIKSVIEEPKNISNSVRNIRFNNPSHTFQYVLYAKLLSVINSLIENNHYAAKRDIYYQYKHLFKNEEHLDRLLIDLARTINVPRTSFNIVTSSNGLVAGDLEIILKDGNSVNCKNGISIPNVMNAIKKIKVSALFVLIVEKDCTFQRLIDDNFLKIYPAILITGKGEPDINTRQLVNVLYKECGSRLKFFCLTDANPFGSESIQIAAVYKYGSQKLAYDKFNLNVPSLKWIGLKLTDLNRFLLANREQYVFKLNESDTRLTKNLIKRLTSLEEFDMVEQLEFMLENDQKAELQYLQHFGRSFLCNVYLRAKLSTCLNL